MVSPADVLATLGCVWAAAAASSPAPRTAHIDLWWQPAPSLDDARSACAATTRCTGVWWNDPIGNSRTELAALGSESPANAVGSSVVDWPGGGAVFHATERHGSLRGSANGGASERDSQPHVSRISRAHRRTT